MGLACRLVPISIAAKPLLRNCLFVPSVTLEFSELGAEFVSAQLQFDGSLQVDGVLVHGRLQLSRQLGVLILQSNTSTETHPR